MLIILWLVLLVVLLFLSLTKKVSILHMKDVDMPKYKTPADYYYDIKASLGVFEGFTTPGVRYIKIVNSSQSSPTFIQVQQLMAYDTLGNNVALKKMATGSAPYNNDYLPGNAVDGTSNKLSHSADPPTPNDFWMVDLGQEYTLSKIVYTNRKNCCKERIIGCTMILMDATNEILEQFRFTSQDDMQTFIPMIGGTKGDTGAMGPAGPTGPAGATGPIGATGPAGATGASGPAGEMGPTGPKGSRGPRGPRGVGAPKGKREYEFSDYPSGTAFSGPNVSGYVGPNVTAVSGPNVTAVSGPNVTAVSGPNGNVVSVDKIGGCAGTQYGCCPDKVTARNADGSSCPVPSPTPSSCSASPYGCCPDNVTAKNADGSNCDISLCTNSKYGCCGVNNKAFKNADGSCSYTPNVGGCAGTQYGCCPDNVTAKNVNGTNCPYPPIPPTPPPPPTPQPGPTPAPAPAPMTCAASPYGCCPDNFTVKNADGSSCAPVQNASFPAYNTSTVFLSGPTKTKSACPEPQPCPPCGRCPEPSFDCKKVPNYSSTNTEFLPVPVLNDFSQFGM